MLEVLNLTKVYKTKGGVDVRALDGVSLRFPERGMVFLLGKSGSGKSTLLNVCGGLDTPTSGEIVVKGRSSREFSQSDFDSYRNTFIGFIFQEYNILNEFSVEDNIALALELQGKPKDKEAVAALLEQVDLTGYAHRKPNTLSGGQKQRIAIARALIKSPEIIMADEPTGALDSNTGKQVFDTLKKLSRDKLVIIVSHDRDFAEQYGDRIIELKDGKILSDVTKTVEEQTAISENVTAVGSTLCVKQGASLSERDFDKIRDFLKSASSDVVITGGEREVKAFREANRMTADGAQEVFRDTEEGCIPKKTYKEEDSRFIRSKLPMRHAAKIGLSGLKTKPFRLAFTAFLCTVAFILFGLLSTLTFYDSTGTFRQTLVDSDYTTLKLGKTYRSVEKSFEYGELTRTRTSLGNATNLSAADIRALSTELGTSAFGGVYVDATVSVQTPAAYYNTSIKALASATEAAPVLGDIEGEYPDAEGEIAISSYLAGALVATKVLLESGDAFSARSTSDLIGKRIPIDLTNRSNGEEIYTVVGIFPSPAVPERFEALENGEGNLSSLRSEFEQWLSDGTSQLAVAHADVVRDTAERYRYSFGGLGNSLFDSHGMATSVGDGELSSHPNAAYAALRDGVSYTKVFLADGKATLAADEALVGSRSFFGFVGSHVDSARWELEGNHDPYTSDIYAESIRAAREAGGLGSPENMVNEWMERYYTDGDVFLSADHLLYGVNAALVEDARTRFADRELFSAARLANSTWHTVRAALEAELDSSDRVGEILDSWLYYLRGGVTDRPATADTYGDEFLAFSACYTTYGEDGLYRSPLVNEWCAAIEEVTGPYLNEYSLVLVWEEAYRVGNTSYYTEGSFGDTLYGATYAEWRTAYAARAARQAEIERLVQLSSDMSSLLMGERYDEEEGIWLRLTAAEREALEAKAVAYYREAGLAMTVSAKLFDNDTYAPYGDFHTYRIVGYFDSDDYDIRLLLADGVADAFWQEQTAKMPYHYVSESAYQPSEDEIYTDAYFAYDRTADMTEYLATLYENRESYDETDTNLVITSGLAENFQMVDSMISEFKQIFLYVGLAMAVFAALLLSNFISVSISHKRREIGILRAVGARSADVFKIFFSESFFITALCVVLSLVGSIVICGAVNAALNELLGASLFVFGVASVAVLVGVALLTAVLATFLPVYNAARRKPVESIRAI